MNKHIIKIKELISDEVCMGTYGLVELELFAMEKDLNDPKVSDLLESLRTIRDRLPIEYGDNGIRSYANVACDRLAVLDSKLKGGI